ncbi:MAG: AAA family ATPase [Bryobacteraceae bacterium]
MSDQPQGKIITFYSYKGGTGRTMALANIAWLLAANGKRVLAIDWDLEAPGLHRYFHPFLEDKELGSTRGLVDFIVDFVEGAHLASNDAPDAAWYEAYSDLTRYAYSLDWEFPGQGTVDFVPAGQQGPGYAIRVASLNWQDFYTKLGGGVWLEAVKREVDPIGWTKKSTSLDGGAGKG